jgi:hypothetical protein
MPMHVLPWSCAPRSGKMANTHERAGDFSMESVVHTGNAMKRDISLFGGEARVLVRIGDRREETLEVF